MTQKIVLATGNKGKLTELSQMLAPYQFKIVAQTELGVTDADETGLTFIENAIIKARHAALRTGLAAIADDSGLAVDVLGGAPGIYSARYAGEAATDSTNIDKLLLALKDVPPAQRCAQFHCVLVYMRHAEDPVPLVCHGVWHGAITHSRAGSAGFGYDPVFFVPTEGCTSAELTRERKQQLSHRGQALTQLLQQLRRRAGQ
jgi:XTP/dITP diphosphohydrolase